MPPGKSCGTAVGTPGLSFTRKFHSPKKGDQLFWSYCTVPWIPGDGIGLEISAAIVKMFQAPSAPVQFGERIVPALQGPGGKGMIPQDAKDSMDKNKIGLKGKLPSLLATVSEPAALQNFQPLHKRPSLRISRKLQPPQHGCRHSHSVREHRRVMPSGNIRANGVAILESVHGTTPGSAGKNLANPPALLWTVGMMVHHMGLQEYARSTEATCCDRIKDGKVLTKDFGGKAKCSDFTAEICQRVKDMEEP